MGRLRILTKGVEPAVLDLPAGVATLGRREDNPLCLPDGSVSGRHCDLAETDGLLTILDLGSTNGTFIKGERTGQGTVAPGEIFKLGGVELCYEVDDAPASSAPAVSTPPPAPVPAPLPAVDSPKLAAPELPSLPKLTAPPRASARSCRVHRDANGSETHSCRGFETGSRQVVSRQRTACCACVR